MFNFEDEDFSSYDFLLNVTDWISCKNENISFEEFLIMLDENGVKFTTKRSYEFQYVVIDKTTYIEFFALMVNNPCIRITRIDFKFDTFQDFKEMYEPYISEWCPSSCVGKKDRFETIYFGSRQSDMYCRFYDKQKESDLKFPCSRLEFEVKGFVSRQFSLRYTFVGIDDALNYLLDTIRDFMFRQKIDGLISFPSYGEYVPFNLIEHNSKVSKFRRFVKQYKKSILDYLDSFDLTPNEFFQILSDEIPIESLLREDAGI